MKSKRLLSLLLTVAILISGITVISSSVSVSANDTGYYIGDSDMNTKIEIKDSTVIQQHLANISKLEGVALLAADSDVNGKVEIKDATVIQQVLAHVNVPDCHVGEFVEPTKPTETTEETTEETQEPTIDPDVPLADTVNEGTILQAFCWSFSTIRANLQAVKEAGFTTIQVSPPNEIKEGTVGHYLLEDANKNGWWMYYQPAGFQINNTDNNAIGKKDEFITMCKEAHDLGLKIIVDTVINHMGTCDNEESKTSTNPMDHLTPRAKEFEPEIVNNKLFHSPWENMQYWEDPYKYSQDQSTYDLTRRCTSRLPDLKTEDSRVQSAIYEYMQELVDCGADGFRFDAAKHIETESDLSKYKSDFWNNTLEKVRKNNPDKECYAYGEILNNCGVNRPFSMYLKHMDVTDSGSIWGISDAVRSGGGNATPFFSNTTTFSKDNVILWDESHDTYCDGSTTAYSVDVRNRIWAITAGRADITCVYLARPDDATSTNPMKSIKLGEGKKTSWSNDVTAQINKFHNRHIGDGEYCTANSGGRAYIERGNSGCIIVGLSGTKSGSVSLANHALKKGVYVDQITGEQFTVSADSKGTIKGKVGNSGIAILEFLKDTPVDPTSPTTPTSSEKFPTKEGCYTVVISDSMGWVNIYAYCWGDETGEVAPWPGELMQWCKTNDFGQEQYCYFVPYDQNNFIVSNGKNDDDPDWVQTGDCTITEHTGIYFDDEKDDKGRYVLKFWDINNY